LALEKSGLNVDSFEALDGSCAIDHLLSDKPRGSKET
jgi:hypothetical protein